MFETQDQAEIHLPNLFGRDDTHLWGYVRLRLHTLWFQLALEDVNVDDEEDFDSRSYEYFVSDLSHLQQAKADPSVVLHEVYLVTPDHLNGSAHWKMEPLDRILRGTETHEGIRQDALIYVLKDGTRYLNTTFDTQEEALENIHLIWSLD